MINWELLSPRNFVVVAAIAVIGYMIFNHFTKAGQLAAAAGA